MGLKFNVRAIVKMVELHQKINRLFSNKFTTAYITVCGKHILAKFTNILNIVAIAKRLNYDIIKFREKENITFMKTYSGIAFIGSLKIASTIKIHL
jgi:hypothetical protein